MSIFHIYIYIYIYIYSVYLWIFCVYLAYGCLRMCFYSSWQKTVQILPLQPIWLSQQEPPRNSVHISVPHHPRHLFLTWFISVFLESLYLGLNVKLTFCTNWHYSIWKIILLVLKKVPGRMHLKLGPFKGPIGNI